MPPRRRRAAHLSAASLPASRLPPGTQELLHSKPSLGDETVRRSTSSPSPRDSHPDESQTRVRKSSANLKAGQQTASPTTTIDPVAAATAAAKLQRQCKRIDDTDPTMPSQMPHPKSKKWKPFDLNAMSSAESSRHNSPVLTAASTSTVRVNTFRTPSGEQPTSQLPSSTMLPKPQQFAHEPEAQHSGPSSAEQGFQVYRPRKGRKDEHDPTDVPSDRAPRQTSLDATYDVRDIYEVFGNALPSQEFLEGNPGCTNGYVQFLQHPNGDVSAHQWSQSRFQWENIGQYSNSRKKIEGQLGADRLREETLSQAGQRDTLRYFRTVAKQREAAGMGLPFGQREIQMLFPLKDAATTPDFSSIEEPELGPTEPETPTRKVTTRSLTGTRQTDRTITPTVHRTGLQANSNHQVSPQHEQYPHGYNSFGGPAQPMARSSTPFSFNPNANFQPRLSSMPPTQTQPTSYTEPMYRQNHAVPAMTPDFSFPVPGPGSNTTRLIDLPSYFHPGSLRGHEHLQWRHGPMPTHHNPPSSHTTQPLTYPQEDSSPYGPGSHRSPVISHRRGTPTPSHVNSFQGNHSERLQSLEKITAAAQRRSFSQANIRTVLYDPVAAQRERQHSDVAIQATSMREHIGGSMSTRLNQSFDSSDFVRPRLGRVFPSEVVGSDSVFSQSPPDAVKPNSSPVPSTQTNPLEQSSPDTSWIKRPYEHSTPLGETPEGAEHRGQFYTAAGSEALVPSWAGQAKDAEAKQRAYDEHLRDWWTSSARLARQDDYFVNIKAADRATNGPNITAPNVSTPPGFPTASKNPWNEHFTRLLIAVEENLAAYVQGPEHQSRDYFTPWSQPPEWAIDRDVVNGNKSFYDDSDSLGRRPPTAHSAHASRIRRLLPPPFPFRGPARSSGVSGPGAPAVPRYDGHAVGNGFRRGGFMSARY